MSAKLVKRALERANGPQPTIKKKKTKKQPKPIVLEPEEDNYQANLRYLQKSMKRKNVDALKKVREMLEKKQQKSTGKQQHNGAADDADDFSDDYDD